MMNRPKKKVAEDLFEGDYDEDYREELYWSDEAKYANEHFGDTYRQTTRFDNDWN